VKSSPTEAYTPAQFWCLLGAVDGLAHRRGRHREVGVLPVLGEGDVDADDAAGVVGEWAAARAGIRRRGVLDEVRAGRRLLVVELGVRDDALRRLEARAPGERGEAGGDDERALGGRARREREPVAHRRLALEQQHGDVLRRVDVEDARVRERRAVVERDVGVHAAVDDVTVGDDERALVSGLALRHHQEPAPKAAARLRAQQPGDALVLALLGARLEQLLDARRRLHRHERRHVAQVGRASDPPAVGARRAGGARRAARREREEAAKAGDGDDGGGARCGHRRGLLRLRLIRRP
jgi:hypothetical protein